MTSEFYKYKYAQTEELAPKKPDDGFRVVTRLLEELFGGVDV